MSSSALAGSPPQPQTSTPVHKQPRGCCWKPGGGGCAGNQASPPPAPQKTGCSPTSIFFWRLTFPPGSQSYEGAPYRVFLCPCGGICQNIVFDDFAFLRTAPRPHDSKLGEWINRDETERKEERTRDRVSWADTVESFMTGEMESEGSRERDVPELMKCKTY